MAKAPRKPKAEPVAPASDDLNGWGDQLNDSFNGAPPEAFDHDGDGKPGGSKPRARGLTEHELTGLFAEAYEAYDLLDERVRFDSKNRRWLFQPGIHGNSSVLLLQVKRLAEVREDRISTSILASDMGREMVADVVRKLDEAMS